MEPINLNEIIFNKTVIGIVCPKCGGDLTSIHYKSPTDNVIKIITLGATKIYKYECTNCKSKFKMF